MKIEDRRTKGTVAVEPAAGSVFECGGELYLRITCSDVYNTVSLRTGHGYWFGSWTDCVPVKAKVVIED